MAICLSCSITSLQKLISRHSALYSPMSGQAPLVSIASRLSLVFCQCTIILSIEFTLFTLHVQLFAADANVLNLAIGLTSFRADVLDDVLAKLDALYPLVLLKLCTEGNKVGTNLGTGTNFLTLDAAKIDTLFRDCLRCIQNIISRILAHLMLERFSLDLNFHLAKLVGGVFENLFVFLLLGLCLMLLAQTDASRSHKFGDAVLDFLTVLMCQVFGDVSLHLPLNFRSVRRLTDQFHDGWVHHCGNVRGDVGLMILIWIDLDGLAREDRHVFLHGVHARRVLIIRKNAFVILDADSLKSCAMQFLHVVEFRGLSRKLHDRLHLDNTLSLS